MTPPVYLADRRLRFFRNRDVSAWDSSEALLAIEIDEEANIFDDSFAERRALPRSP